jgi:hypothetical protein
MNKGTTSVPQEENREVVDRQARLTKGIAVKAVRRHLRLKTLPVDVHFVEKPTDTSSYPDCISRESQFVEIAAQIWRRHTKIST